MQVNVHHWPHGSFHQDLNFGLDYTSQRNKIWNLGLQGNNPLPSNELMIVINTLFIPDVLQNPTLTIIIFFILCPNEKK